MGFGRPRVRICRTHHAKEPFGMARRASPSVAGPSGSLLGPSGTLPPHLNAIRGDSGSRRRPKTAPNRVQVVRIRP